MMLRWKHALLLPPYNQSIDTLRITHHSNPLLDPMKYTEAYRDALAIQRLVAKKAKDPEVPRKELCLLARAFKEMEELKLRLRMKGPPKPVDVIKSSQPVSSRGGMAVSH